MTGQGTLLAGITSRHENPDWYTEIDVWQTPNGNLMAVRTKCRHGVRRTEQRVAKDRAELQDWLGYGALSLALYQDLDWPV